MIELPKDAEGREIPLNTETLYTDRGPIFRVEKFEYVRSIGWCIYGHYEAETVHFAAMPSCLYLIHPDSWEKLEEDLGRGADALNYEACAYFGKSACDCSSCIADKGATCERVVMRDIASRIRKLRGENDG